MLGLTVVPPVGYVLCILKLGSQHHCEVVMFLSRFPEFEDIAAIPDSRILDLRPALVERLMFTFRRVNSISSRRKLESSSSLNFTSS